MICVVVLVIISKMLRPLSWFMKASLVPAKLANKCWIKENGKRKCLDKFSHESPLPPTPIHTLVLPLDGSLLAYL